MFITLCPSTLVRCAPVASPVNIFSPRSQIMPPRPINNFSTPILKRHYRWSYLEKLVVQTEIEYFQHGPSFCALILQLGSSDSVLTVPR